MSGFPKMMIVIGATLIIIGVIWLLVGRFIPLGKLPGDILIKREHTTIYFPIVTTIVISIILSVILNIIGRFR